MDLRNISASADAFRRLPEPDQKRALVAMDIALTHLDITLPALDPDQKAACAWVVRGMMEFILEAPISDVSGLIADTGTAYTMAACKLYGLLEPVA